MMNEVFLQETHGHRAELATPQLSARYRICGSVTYSQPFMAVARMSTMYRVVLVKR